MKEREHEMKTYSIYLYSLETDKLVRIVTYDGTMEQMFAYAERICKDDQYWMWG